MTRRPTRSSSAAAEPWLSSRAGEEIVDLCQAFRIPAAPVGDGRSLPRVEPFRGPLGVPPDRPTAFVSRARPTDSRTAPSRSRPWPRPRRWARPSRPRGCPADAGRAVARPGGGADSADGWLPFAGLRVVDLSIFWAGPYVTMYLASLGADVVKVESPTRPDGFRFAATYPQLGDDWYERSLVWQATNLGKRSLTLDLGTDEGLDLLWELVDGADVLVENFAPGGRGLRPDRGRSRRTVSRVDLPADARVRSRRAVAGSRRLGDVLRAGIRGGSGHRLRRPSPAQPGRVRRPAGRDARHGCAARRPPRSGADRSGRDGGGPPDRGARGRHRGSGDRRPT